MLSLPALAAVLDNMLIPLLESVSPALLRPAALPATAAQEPIGQGQLARLVTTTARSARRSQLVALAGMELISMLRGSA